MPASGRSSPAMMRSRLVLPDPEGPSKATSSPEGMSNCPVWLGLQCAHDGVLALPRHTHLAHFTHDGIKVDPGARAVKRLPLRKVFYSGGNVADCKGIRSVEITPRQQFAKSLAL